MIFRIGFIIDLIQFFISFFVLLLDKPDIAVHQIDLTAIDYLFSLFIILILPLILVIKRNTFPFLFKEAKFTDSVLIMLLVFTFLAPVAAPSHYEFQYNIAVSKLLPPFSSRQILFIKSNSADNNPTSDFITKRDIVYNKGMTGNFVIADSIKESENFIVYQKGKEKIISKSDVESDIETKIFLIGTDEFGRDIFSRLIYGTRLSLFVGLGSVLISFVTGLLLGFIAGYFGRTADIILNRFTDIFLSFPIIFLIILIVALFGNSLLTVISVLGFCGWMSLFKIVRNETASLKNKDFILTTKLLGFSKVHILFKEMFPIMLPSIIVNLVLLYGNVIIAESALSYLGLGLGSNYPSWGAMIEAGEYYLSKAWWMSLFPCLFLFLTLLTANYIGNKLKISFNIQSE